ncbi:MAG TPA: hypothetical protein VLS91_02860 [Acidimicrobiales bacterium]|nr:hypothetical protein [Acidimicrobiales bacterium]
MMLSSVARAVSRVMGSAMLGVATIVLAKSHADDHWSTSPKITIQADVAGEASATPEDASASMTPLAA